MSLEQLKRYGLCLTQLFLLIVWLVPRKKEEKDIAQVDFGPTMKPTH